MNAATLFENACAVRAMQWHATFLKDLLAKEQRGSTTEPFERLGAAIGERLNAMRVDANPNRRQDRTRLEG